ncbi:MAG: type IV toxin-antitoxin system AbiEi family antitoxin domain-containing protein [Actinobacteria bacterium]|nr:type IV toxin-antitoxin system AbiEi family antitoxin domain-containing protein [Actinomycetota bacterium]
MDRNIIPEHRIAIVARRQHGLITRRQAQDTGLTRHQVQHRVSTGQWERLHPGVFRIAGAPVTWLQAAAGACLGAPPGAAASHLTSAALAELGEAPPVPPHVTVTPGRSSRMAGVIVHRAPLPPMDLTIIDGIPCTTVARTLVDCASIVGPIRLQRLVDEALHRRLVTTDQLAAVWDGVRRGPGRSGEAKLRAAVGPWVGPILPGSPAEVRLRQRIVAWGLPEPALQVAVRDEAGQVIGRVDAGWPDVLVGIEYDGARWHGPSRWAADHERQRRLEAIGWIILRAERSDLLPGAGRLEQSVRLAFATQAARLNRPRLV